MAGGRLSGGAWGALVLLGLLLPPAEAWYKHVASPRYHTVGRASGLLMGVRRSPYLWRRELTAEPPQGPPGPPPARQPLGSLGGDTQHPAPHPAPHPGPRRLLQRLLRRGWGWGPPRTPPAPRRAQILPLEAVALSH